MARPRSRVPLNVFINGRLAGRLQRHASGAIDFQYDPAWLDWEHTFPISLSLPLREDRHTGQPVIAVFDNLLPDSQAIRWLLAERAKAQGADCFSLLAAVGRDCVGAMQFLPDEMLPGPAGSISAVPIGDDDIAGIVADLARRPLGVSTEGELRISLAGAQEKTALLYHHGTWHVPLGTTPTTHILKPEIGRLSDGLDLSRSVENEHICMMLTAAMGLPTARTRIVDFAGLKVLAVERFDRRWTVDGRLLRLPMEDCCQALSVPPTLKYETDGGPGIRQILDLLKGSDDPEGDRTLFLKAQIVFWLLAATDGHAKNFSIFLSPGGRFTLAPLYDVMSAQPWFDAGQIQRNKIKMAMAVGTNRHYTVHSIMPRHFTQTAKAAGYPVGAVRSAMEEIYDRAPAAIKEVQNALPADFPVDLADSIVSGFRFRLSRFEAFLESS